MKTHSYPAPPAKPIPPTQEEIRRQLGFGLSTKQQVQ